MFPVWCWIARNPDQPTKEVDGWVNYVEISDDNSVDPVVTTDIDSAPDATKTNDAGGKVETTSDDIVTGIGVDSKIEDSLFDMLVNF